MKTKEVKNALAGLLICIAAILILSELDFNNTKELIGFLFLKIVGFGIGYLGFNILDYEK